ncbi:tail fiber domain-containing protein [Peribacillus butanolivorans]|uniref:tail fiber domain-containing protein n=2 Tax=Peribacillus butanolivorans TaxID=421767 RepID=UPI003672580A
MANLVGDSNNPNVAAVFGDNTDGGMGVYGRSVNGWGTSGRSETSTGVSGASQSGYGVVGGSQSGVGVYGVSKSTGMLGEQKSDTWGYGVVGRAQYGAGVRGESPRGIALSAEARGDQPAIMIDQFGAGNIITGRSGRQQAEVFRVLNNGDVQVRGITLTSDKNAKENFSNVNTLKILDNLASMPILSWNYKEDPSSKRHIGPTAQDFQATFGLNEDDETRISSTDLHGIALAAIQGLNEKNEKLKDENAQLHVKLLNLAERLSALESKGQTE